MPRPGVRTVGGSRQAGNCAVHTGIEDSITQNRQEALQGTVAADLEKLPTEFGQTATRGITFQRTSTESRRSFFTQVPHDRSALNFVNFENSDVAAPSEASSCQRIVIGRE